MPGRPLDRGRLHAFAGFPRLTGRSTGLTRGIYAGILLLLVMIFLRAAKEIGARYSSVFWYPVVLLLFNYILWRATILTYVRGGIRWRDTFYPLADLKANKV